MASISFIAALVDEDRRAVLERVAELAARRAPLPLDDVTEVWVWRREGGPVSV